MADNPKIVNPRLPIMDLVGDYNMTIPSGGNKKDPYDGINQLLAKMEQPSGGPRIVDTKGIDFSGRYPKFYPGMDNEDLYGKAQPWMDKMLHGVTKGLSLMGTTFLQTTVGAVNGTAKWIETGDFTSFYDNEFNKTLDDFNKRLENSLPNYYTQAEKDLNWYSPNKIFSANFIWDGIVKNLGFAAGAALSGYATGAALKGLSAAAKLTAMGKGLQALQAAEEALAMGETVSGVTGKIASATRALGGTANILDKGYRFTVAGLATTGEAGIEAFHNGEEFRENLINEFINDEGRYPTREEYEEIDKLASDVGDASFKLNVGLLSATNYIQFPKILGSSYKAERSVVNSVTRPIVKEGEKFIEKPVGKLARAGRIASYLFNPAEGFEEGAQYAITKGTQDYYDKKYNNDARLDFISSTMEGIRQTIKTDEGMENVLIGGLSGSLMTSYGEIAKYKRKKTATTAALGSERWRNAGLNSAKFSDFTNDTMDSIIRGTAIQEERESAVSEGRVADSKDLEADYIINYLTPRIKYGRFDLVQEDINTAKQLASTEEGFLQLQEEGRALPTDTREAFLNRLSSLEDMSNSVKNTFEGISLRYSGLIDKNGDRLYPDEVIDKMTYAASKITDYNKRIPSLIGQLIENVPNISDIIDEAKEGKRELYDKAVDIIKASDLTNSDEIIEKLSDVRELTKRKQQFTTEFNEIKNSPTKFKEVKGGSPTNKPGEPVPTVKVKTKTGEFDYEIGTKYYVGETGDGTLPFLIIIGEGENGKIRIQDSTGKVRDVSREELEKYRLFKASTVDKSENSRFFVRNVVNRADKTVYWNIGKKNNKDGYYPDNKIPGTLRYDSNTDTLYFVYKDRKDRTKEREVGIDQFKPKGNFNEGVFSMKNLTAEEIQENATDINNREVSGKTREDQNRRRGNRLKILDDLFEELSGKQKNIEKLISQKKGEIANIQKDIASLKKQLELSGEDVDKRFKNTVKFRSATRKMMSAALRLQRMQEQLEYDISDLEAEREDLEIAQSYILDMVDDIDSYPTKFKEFKEELEEELLNLNILHEENGKQINALTELIKSTEDAIKSAIDFLNDLISNFKRKNKGAPLNITPEWAGAEVSPDTYMVGLTINDEWAAFLDANPEFLKRKERYKQDLQQLEDIVAQTEDTEIKANEEKLNYLRDQVDKLNNELSETEKVIKAKQTILDKFEQVAKKYQQEQAEERKLQRDNKIMSQVLGTADKSNVHTVASDPDYEPEKKKSASIIPFATIPTTDDKPHHKRANRFGARFHKLVNREKLSGVYITAKNEGLLIPGLIDHLRRDKLGNIQEDIDRDKIIAFVIVDENGKLVDEFGNTLENGTFENAIYQVMPLEKLEWANGESMFRKNETDENKQAVTDYYKKWRNETLQRQDIGEIHEFSASFGIPQYNETLDDKGNPINKSDKYDTRTAVEDAGLVEEGNFQQDPLIKIPKNADDNPSQGTTSFGGDFVGRVFLQLPHAVIPLQNRHHTEQESETIFNAILKYAENMITNTAESLAENERLLNYLKGVVYWGIPTTQKGERKPTGYNNIFFEQEDGKLMLTISGQGYKVRFTPSSLKLNKSQIVDTIRLMYNNTNSHYSQDLSEPFEEIESISEDGITSRRWINYQAFLLSKKFIAADPSDSRNGESRGELPLTTVLRKLEDKNDTNRDNIYFYATDNADTIIAEEEEQEEARKDVVLDGVTINTLTTAVGKKINFTASQGINEDNYLDKINIAHGGDLQELAQAFKQGKENLDPKERARLFSNALKKDVYGYISGNTVATTPKAKEEVVEEVTVTEATLNSINQRLNALKHQTPEDEELLRVVKGDEVTETEDWNKVEKWLKKNVPNLPIYRVKTLIQATNGRQAWGMFKNAAVYVYENAEAGTTYHEVFEGVWKMFTSPKEQQSILNEFKNRKGSFVDRPTGQTVQYSEATDGQIREQLAEEFRDYVQEKKIPPKPAKGKPWILRMFADLATLIRNFFTGNKATTNTERLFENISKGKYKKNIPYQKQLSFADTGFIDIEEAFAFDDTPLRERIEGIDDRVRNEIIQHMTYATLAKLIKDDKSLFTVPNINKNELYSELKENVIGLFNKMRAKLEEVEALELFTHDELLGDYALVDSLVKSVDEKWNEISDLHQEYLKTFEIEFDENDELQRNDENKVRENDYWDASRIDPFKKANGAIKLLLSTIPITDENGKAVRSTIGGIQLLPYTQVSVSIMNQVYNSENVDEMMKKLKEMAKADPNYRVLYSRLTKDKDWATDGVTFDGIKEKHSLQLLSAFWRTFKKQSPEVKNLYIFDNDEVSLGDAHLSSIALKLRDDYINSIVTVAKSNKGYFKYDESRKAYVADKTKFRESLNSLTARVNFLKKLGIEFTVPELRRLSNRDLGRFKEAVTWIKQSINENKDMVSISNKALDISGRLLTLGELKAKLSMDETESTFFNVSNERVQIYVGTNPMSDFFTFISKVNKLVPESISDSRFKYILSDTFSQGSLMLKKMFNANNDRISGTEDLMKVGYIGGIDNQSKGKRKESSRLVYKDRLIQQLNLGLKGYYLNLIPGDASMEWMINMGIPVSMRSLNSGMDDINLIFADYLRAEVALTKETRKVAKDRNGKELRFMKSVLASDETLERDILSYPEEDVYEHFKPRVDKAVQTFLNQKTDGLERTLRYYGILTNTDSGVSLSNVDLREMSEAEMRKNLFLFNTNYVIANIELHKLIYGDPYQYKDELKRTKVFNSPAQAIVNSSIQMNSIYNKIWNKGYEKGQPGYTDFLRDYFNTITLADIPSTDELKDYGVYEETDGAGIITFKAYRNFRIRAGEWNDNEERQYQFDMAYEKLQKKLPLTKEEEDLLALGNPMVKSAYTPLKPKVAGPKANNPEINEIVVDKFALYPISLRLLSDLNENGGKTTSNAINLYNKMNDGDIDYAVFNTGRKVGAYSSVALYKPDGSFNDAPVKKGDVVKIPLSISTIQTEVPSKETNKVTRGTQVTKLVTMDFMEAGVPIDFSPDGTFGQRLNAWEALTTEEERENASPLYKEIKNNQKLLEESIKAGYEATLKKLGIKETTTEDVNGGIIKSYILENTSLAAKTLRDEILKREMNENIKAAVETLNSGNAIIETTPAYHQIRNVLYSIADKQVVSPKMNGGMKVQLPVSLLEQAKAEVVKVNGKNAYVSDELGFYHITKDGKKVKFIKSNNNGTLNVEDESGKEITISYNDIKVTNCEMMVGRWFYDEAFPETNKLSDEELLKYLNSEEGRDVLNGIGFRIPTQKQNSIDHYVIKQFLPREYGDSVIVPSALVKKAGSDFDIDKLTMYFKNVYEDNKGKVRSVPFLGYGQEAIDKFKEMYYNGELWSKDRYSKIEQAIQEYKGAITQKGNIERVDVATSRFLASLFGEEYDSVFVEDYVRTHSKEEVVDRIVERLYKQSLENEYMRSMEALISNPLNFERLIKPNSAAQLEGLSAKVADAVSEGTFDYSDIGNMLDIEFMSKLRHAFVSGKYAIGIAAVNQTNHALNQRQPVYIDVEKIKTLDMEEQEWLGDGKIKFEKYNKMRVGNKMVPTLSMVRNAERSKEFPDGQDISDINTQFVDGYVDISKGPWIMELGATPNVTSTWLFLVKLGVPIDTVTYFMNQPIIKDYLRTIDNSGYSWLFISDFVEAVKESYEPKVGVTTKPTMIPSKTALENMMGKTADKLSPIQLEQQKFMLDEFLKYAKMANHLFYVTQGTNFDTANFNDPYLVFKKMEQLKRAQNSIIGGVDDILKNSFVGYLGATINDVRNSLATILKSDQPKVRGIIEQTLLPYINTSDRDFVKIARKAVSDLFDYALQTNEGLNVLLRESLVENGGTAREIQKFVESIGKTHPLYNNEVIRAIKVIPSRDVDGVNNVRIKSSSNRVYDQNNMIYAFRELRDYLGQDSKMYDNLITLAVLQSGLSGSTVSFTSLIPFEDFNKIYDKTVNKLESLPNLRNFNTLNVFQRVNWGNSDIVPYVRARWTNNKKYNPSMEFLPKQVKQAVEDNNIPPVLTQNVLSRVGEQDHLVYSWEKMDELITPEWQTKYPSLKGYQLIKRIKSDMRSVGDFSYINKGLFEKVVDNTGKEFTTQDKKGNSYYIYKAINAWGDSWRAKEFYDVEHPSVLNNRMIKVDGVDNNTIIDTFLKKTTNQKTQSKENIAEVSQNQTQGNRVGGPAGIPQIQRPSKKC